MKKILILGITCLMIIPSLSLANLEMDKGARLVKGNVEDGVLVIAGIPADNGPRFGITKPTWIEVEQALPILKETGVNAIFIWAPYEHTVPGDGSPSNITVYTEQGEIQLNVTYSRHIMDYLKPDPERGSEEEFLHLIEESHSLGIKVIAQLQVTVANPGDFIYEEHPDWVLQSIYDKPAVFWPWAIARYGYIVNKAHPDLINYVTETIIPHWVNSWGVDGIYLDSEGMAYCDLHIRDLIQEVGCVEGYECLTPVDGYYSPEPLVSAMKTKIEQMEIEVGRDILFPCEMIFKTVRDMPEDDIIQALHGNGSLLMFAMGDPRVDRTLGKYHDFVMNYNFRNVLKQVFVGTQLSYSHNYSEYFELEQELDKKYTETARFVNMWVESIWYLDLLKPNVANPYITLDVTAPGSIVWIGVYQLPPQEWVSEEIFGYDSDVLREWYTKTIKIKEEYKALQSDNIENALISPEITRLIAYNRWDENESVTVIVNAKSTPRSNCIIKTRFNGDEVTVYDVLSGEKFEGNPSNISIQMPAYSSRILVEEYPIEIEIEKPRKGYLYSSDQEIMPTIFHSTIIIGGITVETNVLNEISIDRVEFYIDDELKYVDEGIPYQWLWNEFAVGNHEIQVIAYDNEGNNAKDKIEVKIFNIGG